jgi:hypothetical protein
MLFPPSFPKYTRPTQKTFPYTEDLPQTEDLSRHRNLFSHTEDFPHTEDLSPHLRPFPHRKPFPTRKTFHHTETFPPHTRTLPPHRNLPPTHKTLPQTEDLSPTQKTGCPILRASAKGGMQSARSATTQLSLPFSSQPQKTVISTEAAHAFVSSAVEKSASLPDRPRSRTLCRCRSS